MRFIFLITIVLLALPATAKEVSGRVVDAAGESIAYVNIGIRNTTTGTLSGRDGTFTLTIPDSLAARPLSLSHVSYLSVDATPSEAMRVVMQAADYQVDQIVIRPGRSRNKRLTNTGIRFPGGSAAPTKPGEEIGSIVDVERDFSVRDIRFTVLRCTAPALLRFNIYRIDNEEFTNVIRTPIYYRIAESREALVYRVEPQQTILLDPGRYFVAVEIVELVVNEDRKGKLWEHTLYFPAYIKSSYVRNNSMGRMHPESVNIGLSVSGTEYE